MAFTCFFSSTFDFDSFDEIFLLVYYYQNLTLFVLTNFLYLMKNSLEFLYRYNLTIFSFDQIRAFCIIRQYLRSKSLNQSVCLPPSYVRHMIAKSVKLSRTKSSKYYINQANSRRIKVNARSREDVGNGRLLNFSKLNTTMATTNSKTS